MKTPVELNGKTILVTGAPGFIGSYLVIRLLKELTGGTIVSLDNMNDYYEVSLKEWRLAQIEAAAAVSPVKHVFVRGSIADKALVNKLFEKYRFVVVVRPKISPTSAFSSPVICQAMLLVRLSRSMAV